ncbi:MAG TPA: translation elongation factor EF-1 subunit alpha [Thermoplasmatales archaeon]|nr:MAG: translation elongation factor EF-1 subunit alpha [Thermoplasmata archaeon]HDM25001.1 translation elongation factor EF-1 subunit alpha [Thermoplasmatales archaeon]HEB37410.1 translation elongation factor EF-1 subunit alpha [Thermoplasmatales archaeon]
MAEKPHLNLVVIGHVDHGKSTLVGRILLDTGQFPEHMVEKFKEEAKAKGKESFALAWIFDQLKEERERGLTIDVAHKRFDTEKYYFTIIDAPGHRDFVKNMITGTSQADAAILVVAAPEGVMAQTKEHAFLARTLGVDQLVVAINKMDEVNYDKAKFEEVKNEVDKLLKSIGYKDDQIQYVPVSAFKGDNASKDKGNLSWWDGPTILEAVNNFKVPEKPVDKPLRWPIQDVYSITGVGTVPVGKVETGVMKPGMTLVFKPSTKPGGVTGEVKTIEMHHEQIQQALPGDNIGVNVRGVGKNDIRRGDVAGPADNPPTVAKSFIARIMVLNHPSVITKGYTPVFHCHTAQVACRFEELLKKFDPRTGEVKEENPEFLKTGDAALVKIVPTRPMVIETAKDFPQLGRFAVRDMGQTVAAGVCVEVEKA